MKFKTLFRAYAFSRNRMCAAIEARGRKTLGNGRQGIGVASDPDARTYQRYQRLAERIHLRIDGVRVCPICTARAGSGFHYSTCSRYGKEG